MNIAANEAQSPDLRGQLVVIGAGQAGAAIAVRARREGWPGPIMIIGDEPTEPYQKPPLSKGWLAGKTDARQATLYSSEVYRKAEISLLLGTNVVAIDPAGKIVETHDGQAIPFDVLVIATGSRARPLSLPHSNLSNVLSLRSMSDAERLAPLLTPGKRMVAIGGGYVGLEVAATARSFGVDVVVIEREARLLARVASAEIASFMQARHEREGTEFKLNANAVELTADRGRVTGVVIDSGQILPADIVLVGVGASPAVDLAASAGLECEDGILVDEDCRTSAANIYAAGDCARRKAPSSQTFTRFESVPSALEQAKVVAAAICNQKRPTCEVPWFWSDQFDVKLQMAGIAAGANSRMVRGDPATQRFSVLHLDDEDRLVAIETVNSAGDFMVARKLIAEKATLNLIGASNVGTPLSAA